MDTLIENRRWHDFYTKPIHEKKALERLSIKGFEVFCPMIISVKQWSDRKKKIRTPLIPSYIFVRVNKKEKSKVLEDPSVFNYIYCLGKPAIVKEKKIVKLKQILSTESNMQCNIEFLKKGTKFKMDTGPFREQIADIKNIFGRKISVILDGLNLRITFNLKEIN
tara:strand:+ start:1903 stop:2397 length:495 start_codon:yes stop_codon:yes gene_type:complete